MGKGQSKHGQCYVVNAHFNPLCQLEESNSVRSIETPIDSQDSGLQLTPDISFTLSEDNKSATEKDTVTKCDLEVYLPKESLSEALVDASNMDSNSQQAVEEQCNNKENKVLLECMQNSNNEEKQEFSFVLRNYNTNKSGKDDVEKIVVHSICEALKSSLKLPTSGSHTLKVHLSVSPDSDKESTLQDTTEHKTNIKEEKPFSEVKVPKFKDCFSHKNLDCVSSVDNSPTKYSEIKKCCHDSFAKLVHCSASDVKPNVSFSPHLKRHQSSQKKDSRRWIENSEHGGQSGAYLNIPHSPHYSEVRDRRYSHRHARHKTSKDCSHYLDLARSDFGDAKLKTNEIGDCDLRYSNPAFYSPRRSSNKSNASCHTFNQNLDFPDYHTPKKTMHSKLQDPEIHSNILKYKLLREAKNNALDLSFDPYDTGKPNEESYHHRRSKSYDTNECLFVESPKSRHRNCTSGNCSRLPYLNTEFPPSPSCHHRHRHREREKDKQRAMQQVASWLERENLDRVKQKRTENWQDFECDQKNSVIERHEYHHIHEHHHYYHYIES